MKNETLRMCIVCRQMLDKRTLTRVVKNKSGEVFIDLGGKQAGRGAYVCNQPECLKKLSRQKVLNKAFKCQVPDEIYESLVSSCNEKN